jgi:hypothetical protein
LCAVLTVSAVVLVAKSLAIALMAMEIPGNRGGMHYEE